MITGQEKLDFTFTIDEINSILTILGEQPFTRSANLIGMIQTQASPQIVALQPVTDVEVKNDKAA